MPVGNSGRDALALANHDCFWDYSVLGQADVLVLELFAGTGAIGVGIERALAELGNIASFLKVVTLMFETDPRCRRLLAGNRCSPVCLLSPVKDATGVTGSAFALTDGDGSFLQLLLKAAPRIRWLLVTGGPSCQPFSMAGARMGFADKRSTMSFIIPVVTTLSRKLLSDRNGVLVDLLLENVVMDDKSAEVFSLLWCVRPLLIDAGTECAATRRRYIWTSLLDHNSKVFEQPQHLYVDASSILDDGWLPLWHLMPEWYSGSGGSLPAHPRFATLLRPFKAGCPMEYPAPFPRYPLSRYTCRGLVYRADAPEHDISEIKSRCASAWRGGQAELRTPKSDAVARYSSLVLWIHKQGGERILRPLNGDERERALGLPVGSTSVPACDGDGGCQDPWLRAEASGNALCPAIIQQLASPAFKALAKAGPPPLPLSPRWRTAGAIY